MLKWCCYKLTFKQLFSVVHNQEASKFTPYQVCFYSILTDWNFLNIWKSESKTENRYNLGRRSSLHTENLISSSKKCIEKKRKREREREREREIHIYTYYTYIYIYIYIYIIYMLHGPFAHCPPIGLCPVPIGGLTAPTDTQLCFITCALCLLFKKHNFLNKKQLQL